jgi:hypothetical protein
MAANLMLFLSNPHGDSNVVQPGDGLTAGYREVDI